MGFYEQLRGLMCQNRGLLNTREQSKGGGLNMNCDGSRDPSGSTETPRTLVAPRTSRACPLVCSRRCWRCDHIRSKLASIFQSSFAALSPVRGLYIAMERHHPCVRCLSCPLRAQVLNCLVSNVKRGHQYHAVIKLG